MKPEHNYGKPAGLHPNHRYSSRLRSVPLPQPGCCARIPPCPAPYSSLSENQNEGAEATEIYFQFTQFKGKKKSLP